MSGLGERAKVEGQDAQRLRPNEVVLFSFGFERVRPSIAEVTATLGVYVLWIARQTQLSRAEKYECGDGELSCAWQGGWCGAFVYVSFPPDSASRISYGWSLTGEYEGCVRTVRHWLPGQHWLQMIAGQLRQQCVVISTIEVQNERNARGSLLSGTPQHKGLRATLPGNFLQDVVLVYRRQCLKCAAEALRVDHWFSRGGFVTFSWKAAILSENVLESMLVAATRSVGLVDFSRGPVHDKPAG